MAFVHPAPTPLITWMATSYIIVPVVPSPLSSDETIVAMALGSVGVSVGDADVDVVLVGIAGPVLVVDPSPPPFG